MENEYRGPKLDPVKKEYLTDLNLVYACEDCSHYDAGINECTFGFRVRYHLRDNQLRELEKTGQMAICRLMEID
jgi:hypothetical protein